MAMHPSTKVVVYPGGKGSDRLQRFDRMDVTLAIGHADGCVGKKFEGTLAHLLRHVHLVNIKYMEQPAHEGNDKVVTDDIHAVDTFWEQMRGLLLHGVPETDCAILGPGNDGICKGEEWGKGTMDSGCTGSGPRVSDCP